MWDIDGELLGRLTNDDLKDTGIASFGHRKKMLEAIAALVVAPKLPFRYRSPQRSQRRTTPPPSAGSSGCLFGDLVGSTALSTQLDRKI